MKPNEIPLHDVSLDDKYKVQKGRVFMTGTQALVRLPMLQRLRDRALGLNTAGYVTGYRGSPLGSVDQEYARATKVLAEHQVQFHPAVNEDLAATAVWGTQQLALDPEAACDGVFSIWYGKGPGVDRSGDVFRHANAAGTARHGGVLVIAGDDHAAKSSTFPHQTEHVFKAMMMPVLAPANIQEYLDYGLHGFAMSRYSGCWVAFKALADTVETAGTVTIDPFAVDIKIPEDFPLPEDGLNIRWPDPPLVQEARLINHKLYAALAYCRANQLDRTVIDSPAPRLGIVTCGKSYLDVRQAFDDLGIDEALAAQIGIRLYKVGMVWPLEAEGIRRFAEGLDEILVIEEKRQLLEYQIKEALYNWKEEVRPRVIGKFDEKGEWALPHGNWLLPAAADLTPAMIARVIAARIARFHTSERIEKRLAFLNDKEAALAASSVPIVRTPHFCSGCPHNTSTRVPEGSQALAGIGCHYMATWLSPEQTTAFCQMGGEGVAWLGRAPFTKRQHVFANLGDGTYFHSGLLAIRAAVAAKANITYKILFNDAVAMTGGQPHDGSLSVPIISRQLQAEGVGRIVVVSDRPELFTAEVGLASGTEVRHRDELDAVQRELREIPGVTALIYEQTCAAEKRRRRKRGKFPDPAVRAVINEAVCDNCGDCSAQSNCLSVTTVDTPFGRKRQIDQSSCNKDFSCVKGFCPSFVTVEGGQLRKQAALAVGDELFATLPEPQLPPLDRPWNILVNGVGGTGVVTIGALLGMAAHLEGKNVSTLDMAGLAQKGGAVWSHIRIAADGSPIHAARIAAGEADALLGCDLVVSAGDETLAKLQAGVSRAIVNTAEGMTSEFVRGFARQARTGDVQANPDPQFGASGMQQRIAAALAAGDGEFLDATALATALLGDSIATNPFMLGMAWQRGLIPLSAGAILRAIEINGAAVAANIRAFHWGRLAAVDLPQVLRLARGESAAASAVASAATSVAALPLAELVEQRAAHLVEYQDQAYAARYRQAVERIRVAEQRVLPGSEALTVAVAHNYHKLLAIKDEYEVARLHRDPAFQAKLAAQFEGDYRVVHHFAPPVLNGNNPQKRRFGPWTTPLLSLLARCRRLRNTALDPFAHSHDRQLDRQLLADYEQLLARVEQELSPANHAAAVALASLPADIRGYGPVRERYAQRAEERRRDLWQDFTLGRPPGKTGGRGKALKIPVVSR
ncbi:indolepyruvate ferredoxin oxidoreductase family protein [Dechloromonas sp. ZY10]|uniref:indolepyruvate ferredoxin oxidoreductase family protein n=1 Tax=Dechloromonas aquae TaxID=2664436 RepID=UPI003529AA64